ncbi:MAG: molybdate ABC transporter substrate-binding protein [Chloroflexi bacterium]|nr:molybdate ABC transporter substrate-binding protein [Chloroflexota bacterium]
MRRFLPVTVLALLIVAFMPSCGNRGDETRTLTVFAAASLTDLFEDLGARFEAQHEGTEVIFSFAGSSQLSAQLIAGAPADVFASANPQQMSRVVDAGLVVDNPQIFAYNRLVVIVPDENPAQITTLADLAREDVALVTAAPAVPVRVYTDQMLAAMAASAAYGPEYRRAVLDNIVSEESNVRQVVVKVALGEADAGVVYASDVTADVAADLSVITVPAEFNVMATYLIVPLQAGEAPELAQSFVEFVRQSDMLVSKWGFMPLSAGAAE